ncbi:MAG TPA: glycosyltransferase family 39 protein [Chitinophagaceae bacterium]|nr:glycosyltransferase family 39 protein [Chitinophagaceae bacterium]
MILFLQKHHRVIFYSTWLLLALAQSFSTELIADEAYYWVYSRFPAWGYFDHPPMIAMLIKGGYAVFQSELGVRLLCVLLSVFTISITESLTDRKNPFLFYTIVLSIGTLQIAGFLAVPDTPLLFFTALFFYCYRHFLKNFSWSSALLLGFSVTLMFYTKYHALLIVILTLLSDWKLLARRQTWLAGFFVLLLFTPHLFWQWQNDWVSFRYHLFESNVSVYRFSNTTEYLLGQLLVAGPLAGLILLPAVFLYKTKTGTERALKFTIAGLYFFFLLSSARGKVEANWTMPVLIPLVVLSYQFLNIRTRWINPLRIIAFVSLLLIMAGRIYLVKDIGPDNAVKRRFQHNREWALAIAEKTKNQPVVFLNSYQRSSLFWFYSGNPSHSLNSWLERKNNYNFWPTEKNLLGKPVFIADIYNVSQYPDSVYTKKGWVGIAADSLFSSLSEIKIIPGQKLIEIAGKNNFLLRCRSVLPDQYLLFLNQHPGLKTKLLAGVFNGKKLIREMGTGITAQQLSTMPGFEVYLNFESILPGKYDLRFAIRSNGYPPAHNSANITLLIH